MEPPGQAETKNSGVASPEGTKKQHESSFYQTTISQIPPNFVELLEKYSGIPQAEQTSHLVTLRNEAYKAHHYPCLGLFRFTLLSLSSHPLYKSYVLPTLLTQNADDAVDEEPVFLDLGTCLGQDIRKLLFDGVPPSRVFGADLLPDFIDLGYRLFRDQDKIPPDHFLAPADVFDDAPDNELSWLDNKVTILQTNSVFHLFNYANQLVLAKRVVKLLRRPAPGGPKRLILGSQNGNVEPAEYPRRSGNRNDTMFRHNEKSWADFWERVSAELGGSVKFTVESRTIEPKMPAGIDMRKTWRGEGYRWMVWSVWVRFM